MAYSTACLHKLGVDKQRQSAIISEEDKRTRRREE